jgi:tRNA-dihydrouridine synthase B
MDSDPGEHWRIGAVDIPSRVALAPMAGVSIRAFRRQGRRFGAGLVTTEMISAAGLHQRSRRTLDYLRFGPDEQPLAVQIFGSDPALMAEGGRLAEAAGAALVDLNFGCPVRKVTSGGAGAALLEQPELARRIVAAVAEAVSLPVTVKMRRGTEPGSRRCLELAPALVEAGAAALTLHPRSLRQMYGGSADHSLTVELTALVTVPVIASGDVDSHRRARELLEQGVAAVMVGRAVRGNPWLIREVLSGRKSDPSPAEIVAELVFFIRETVRELGEKRAAGFLKKFYGWYLGRGRFPRALRRELVELGTPEAVERRLFEECPDSGLILARLEASTTD